MAVFQKIFVTLLVVFFVVGRSFGEESEEDGGLSSESVSAAHRSHIKVGGGFIKKGGFKGGKGKFGTTFISKKGFSTGHFRDGEETPSENPPQTPEVNEEQQRSTDTVNTGSAQLWQMPYTMHRITDPREMRYGWVYQVDHNEPAVGTSYQLHGTPQHLLFRDVENTISGFEQNTMDMNQQPLDQPTNFRKVEPDSRPHPEAPSKPDASITSQIRQMQNPAPTMIRDSMTVNQPTQFRLDMPQVAPPEEPAKPSEPLEQDSTRKTSEQDDSKPSNPSNTDTEQEQNPTKQLVDVRQANEERPALYNTAAWARSQVFQACNPNPALRQMTQQQQMPQQLIFQQQQPQMSSIEHLRQMPMPQQQMLMPNQQQPSIEQRQFALQQEQQMAMQNQQVSGLEQQQQPIFAHRQMPMINQQMSGVDQQQQQQTSFEHRQMTVPNQQMSMTNQRMPMINQQMSTIQQQQPFFEHRQMLVPNAQQQSTFQQPGEQRFMIPQQQMQTFEQQMSQQQPQNPGIAVQPNLEGRMEGSEVTKPDQVKLDEMRAAMEESPEARHFHHHHHKKHGHHHQNIYITVPSYEKQHYGVYGGYAGGYGGGYSQGAYGHGGYGHKAYSGYGYVGAENPIPQEPSTDPSPQPEADSPAETATNSRK